MNNLEFTVTGDGERLDTVVAAFAGITRSRAAALITDGNVTLNGKPAQKSARTFSGDTVKAHLPQAKPYCAQPQNIPLDIYYEDDDLLVVNKPKGMVVHPAAGNYGNTLVNAVLYHCPDTLSGIGGVMRPGIIHRIDKNTSGLLLVAKNDEAHIFLSAQIKAHTLEREYEAVVYGNIKDDEGVINAPIGRHPVKRKQMAVTDKNSKYAVTHFKVLERFGDFTHIRCRLETGRTHQIRVHMSYIGHPLAGDDVYGPKKVIKSLSGQCLHAKKIGFIHPATKEKMVFESNLPDYFVNFLEVCRRNGNI
ncbi:MAG: RluA family pseudouridine synthase [Clostridia bacterium]|nr:RluA family pseudouridine synthase [Clostridia bacterium]